MIKYDVMCPMCNGVFHETNGRFKIDAPANGSMFETKQHVKDAAWSTFPPYDTTEYANIVCPSCDAAYLDAEGRVLRLIENGECVEDTHDDLNKVMDELLNEYEPEIPIDIIPHLTGKVSCPVCGEMYMERGLRVHIAAKHPEKA